MGSDSGDSLESPYLYIQLRAQQFLKSRRAAGKTSDQGALCFEISIKRVKKCRFLKKSDHMLESLDQWPGDSRSPSS